MRPHQEELAKFFLTFTNIRVIFSATFCIGLQLLENRDQVYNTFIQNTKFVMDLMLQAYETGLPTNFSIEIKESTVKAISKEETYPINAQLDELREDIINGTMIECFQNGKTFAFKRKVNIVPVK